MLCLPSRINLPVLQGVSKAITQRKTCHARFITDGGRVEADAGERS